MKPSLESPSPTDALFEQGLGAHREGRLPQARALYRRVLAKRADHFDALHLTGVIDFHEGDFTSAAMMFESALAVHPNSAVAHNNRGMALQRLGRAADALSSFDRAIVLNPDYVEARANRADTLGALGRHADALTGYDSVLVLDALHALAWSGRGVALCQLARHAEALASCQRAVTLAPDLAHAWLARGSALRALGRNEEAINSFDRAIVLNPNDAHAHNGRGATLQAIGQPADALASYDRALALDPGFAEASYNRGAPLRQLKRLDEALAAYDLALTSRPAFAAALSNRSAVLCELGRALEALEGAERAIEVEPGFADGHVNRGVALHALRRPGEALQSYDRALALQPGNADAHYNRGVVLRELRRLDEALTSFDLSLRNGIGSAAAHINRGATLQELGRSDDALAAFDFALALDPGLAAAHCNRGAALQELGRLEEAGASFSRALALDSDHPFLYGTWLHLRMHLCEWEGFEGACTHLSEGILRGDRVTSPFPVIALVDSPALQRRAAELWAGQSDPPEDSSVVLAGRARDERIAIGYFSADFHNHATMHLMAGLFERHDRQRFKLVAYSFGPDRQDAVRARAVAAFDRFHDVRGQSDSEIAALAKDAGIDIAIDLKGPTHMNRAGIFAHRAAPVQVSYIGYPGTTGAPYIDYLIADRILIPEGSREHYSEKVVYLPGSYQVNDSKRSVVETARPREAFGLPPSGFVFCCFNCHYKILPSMFDSWMRILRSVDGSVLWLLTDSPVASVNLRREAEARGVAAERLVPAPRLPPGEHLARHQAADLFLDTFPCNAHTTASDALWAGVPLLTLAGDSFASRVAASLLHAIGLPELVVADQQHYEALAIALATDPDRHRELKRRLAQNRDTALLFDTSAYARHLEKAFVLMHERQLAGLPPDHIVVER